MLAVLVGTLLVGLGLGLAAAGGADLLGWSVEVEEWADPARAPAAEGRQIRRLEA